MMLERSAGTSRRFEGAWATGVRAVITCALIATGLVAASTASAAVTTGTLTGTVANAAGQPVAGMQVMLASYPPGTSTSVRTDAHGAFTVSAAAGDYVVYFYDGTGTYVYGCFDPFAPGSFVSLSGPVNCALETLTAGQTSQMNVTVLRARHLTGTITGADGSRLGKIFVDALDADGNVQGEVQSQPDGTFSFTLAPGRYQLQVYGTTFFSGGCYRTGVAGNLSSDSTGCTLVDATASDASGLNMTLPASGVTGFTISGTVTGSGGAALSGIEIDAWQLDGMASGFAFTDAAGHFSVRVPAGHYEVSVTDPTHTYASGCFYRAGTGHFAADCPRFDTIAVSSADVAGIDMTLAFGGLTPYGTDVYVTPSVTGGFVDASISFAQVRTAGTTSLQVTTSGPDPVGFNLGAGGFFYNISTTATYSGSISLCFRFNPAAYSDPSALRLYHYAGGWQDITSELDLQAFRICGSSTSLSSFALGVVKSAAKQDQAITFAPMADQTYGAAPVKLTATAGSGLPVTFEATGSCSLSGTTVVIGGVGTCSVTATQVGDDQWDVAPPVTQAFTVAPAKLLVTANSATKLLGAANPALTTTISGFVNGETATTSGVTGAASCSTTATAQSVVGTYPITCTQGTLTAVNYTFTFKAGTLSVGYRFDGFLQPINDTGHLKTCGADCQISVFKAGSTVPVRLLVKDVGGHDVQTGVLPVWLTPVLQPASGATVGPDRAAASATGPSFRWEGKAFGYNWSTKGLSAGTYLLSVRLGDGSIQHVLVALK
jgi:hypothetical protein